MPGKTKDLEAGYDEGKRGVSGQIQALQSQLDISQAKITSLDGDLAQAHEQLAHSDRNKAAEIAAQGKAAELQAQLDEAKRVASGEIQALQSRLADAQAKTTSLETQAREQAQVDRDKASEAAELQAQLDEAKRGASGQIQALQSQLADAQAKITSLGTQVREQLVQADRDKAAEAAELQVQHQLLTMALDEAQRSASGEIQALQSRLADAQAKITSLDTQAHEHAPADRDKAAELQAQLDEAKRGASGQTQALQNQLTNAQAKITSLVGELAEAREQLAQADRAKAAEAADTSLTASTSMLQHADVSSSQRGLARVVVRYTRDSNAARERAVTTQLMLQARGMNASDPVATPVHIGKNTVIYFYSEDQSSAKVIAKALAIPESFRKRPTKTTPHPTPGTIEVSIAR